MFLKKTYRSIKRFILKLLIYFLPRPESAPEGSEVVTEKGVRKIISRLFFFFVAGMWLDVALIILRRIGDLDLISQMELMINSDSSIYLNNAGYDLSIAECIVLTFCLIYFVLMPFLRYMYRWLKVTGVIYAISVGFILTCSMSVQELHQTLIDILSILCTAVMSLLPLYLLKYKNMKLPKYLARFVHVSFAVVTLGGSVVKILNQIPFLEVLTGHVIELSKYTRIRIAGSGIKAFLAFMFMFLAYDRMRDYVVRGVSRKYEWLVAFTGFYTVCVIMLKVNEMLTLIIK